jgi:hypothetical protein
MSVIFYSCHRNKILVRKMTYFDQLHLICAKKAESKLCGKPSIVKTFIYSRVLYCTNLLFAFCFLAQTLVKFLNRIQTNNAI